MKQAALILFVCMWSLLASGQADTIPESTRFGSIERFPDFIIVRLSQRSDVEKLAVIENGPDFKLAPNASSITTLSANYRFLSFSYNYIAKFLPGNNDNSTKGKTKHAAYAFAFNLNHWNQELSYSRTKGYYLENTEDFDPNYFPGKPYLQFPEFRYTQFRGRTAYKFNNNFSVPALMTQTERQLKSAGSFVAELRYRYYITKDRTPPSPGTSSQKANNIELLPGFGYDYTYVITKKIHLSAGSTGYAGYLRSRLTTMLPQDEIKTTQHNAIFRIDGRAGAGYNSKRFFAGFYVNLSGASYRQQGSHVKTDDNRTAFQVFAGYRIHAPRWLKQRVDDAMRIITPK